MPVTFANLTIVADEWFQPYLYHPTRKRIFWDAIRNSLPLDQFQVGAQRDCHAACQLQQCAPHYFHLSNSTYGEALWIVSK